MLLPWKRSKKNPKRIKVSLRRRGLSQNKKAPMEAMGQRKTAMRMTTGKNQVRKQTKILKRRRKTT
jgi:hypothetical protein